MIFRCPVTLITLAVCVAVYLRQMQDSSITDKYAFNYYSVKRGEYYRILSGAFLHGSPVHLIMNMYSLYSLGTALEPYLGSVWYALLLFGSVAAGSLACMCFRLRAAIGMSGGLYGLMFFYFALVIFARPSSILYIVRTSLPNILINFIPGIAWQAHLGGAVLGVIAAVLHIFL